MIPTHQILIGDAAEKLKELPDRSVQMCVTSPPYYGLRDYGDPRQLGSENTPGEYIERLVEISREIRRVLRDDGTYWLNLGDSYYNYRPGAGQALVKQSVSNNDQDLPQLCARRANVLEGFKEKDRMMIPARVALELHSDGWYLRDEIVWNKPNPMPESVTDRTTKTHEFIYMLTKNKDYYYDNEAIQEPISQSYAADMRPHGVLRQRFYPNSKYIKEGMLELDKSEFPNGERATTRNKRSVWTVNTFPYPDAHFAAFPPDLIKPCIMAGSRYGDTVLDPFGGRGTTGEVCIELGRSCILIELNPKYAELCRSSVDTTPGLPL
jgi:DNA modification methylase